MCLVLFACGVHTEYPLVLLANRDEFHQRPTQPARFWPQHPDLYGGRDLSAGGTWLGVTRGGRIAAVTNYRDGLERGSWPRSRGELVAAYLDSDIDPPVYLDELAARGNDYAPCNLLVGDLSAGTPAFWHYSNQSGRIATVPSGIHGLSNHLLDTPWPKVERGRSALAAALDAPDWDPATLMAILADHSEVSDGELPDTGVDLDWERRLAPIFIRGETYGTRCSTLILLDRSGELTFVERSFGPNGAFLGEQQVQFRAASARPAT